MLLTENKLTGPIKSVAAGPKGTRDLTDSEINTVACAVESGVYDRLSLAVLFTAIYMKGSTASERLLAEKFVHGALNDAKTLLDTFCSAIPGEVRRIFEVLAAGERLSESASDHLAHYCCGASADEVFCAMILTLLRMQVPQPIVYTSFLRVLEEQTAKRRIERCGNKKIVQLSEPFDGTKRSFMLTPILADYLQKHHRHIAVSSVSDSPGPKNHYNLKDLAQRLATTSPDMAAVPAGALPRWGYYIDLAEACSAIGKFIDIRRRMIKRPILSTLEKFINPAGADLLITSAFHGAYLEIMPEIFKKSSFQAAIIFRGGPEGAITCSLLRTMDVVCLIKDSSGGLLRRDFRFKASDLLGLVCEKDFRVDGPDIRENVDLIVRYADNPSAVNPKIAKTLQATLRAVENALAWLQEAGF